jgi:ABC-type glycerol-3-phosphate transport system substrate-binding protein
VPQLSLAYSPRPNTHRMNELIRASLKEWNMDEAWEPHLTPWHQVRSIVKDSLFKKTGAEIAQVGTTWVSGLVGMHALRPFAAPEIARIQHEGNFMPIAWKAASLEDHDRLWMIPWTIDTRVMYYWGDMFDVAKVDAQTAFKDIPSFESALEKLQAHGIQTPWASTTDLEMNTVHHIGMWLWAYGGNFLSPDGKKVLFIEPEAMQAIHAYFGLNRFMPQTENLLSEGQILDLFFNRQVACILTGPWFINHVLDNPQAYGFSRLQASLPPAPPFIGGSSLVVMGHLPAHYEQSAIDLLVHLTGKQFVADYSFITGYHIPMRIDVLDSSPFVDNPFLPVLLKALDVGHTLPNTIRWGIVEDELVKTFSSIWAKIQTQPDQSIASIIESYLEPLANRLNRTLAI